MCISRHLPTQIIFLALFASAAGLGFGRAAPQPQPVPPQGMNFSLEGKITDKTAGKLTVSTLENILFHVTYDDKTDIKYDDGIQASSQNLRVGVHIKVDGELAESGDINAGKIVIVKAQKDTASEGTRLLPRFRTSSPVREQVLVCKQILQQLHPRSRSRST
jgi:hypothetical protein